MTSTRSAPSRRAGASGVFSRRLPSQKNDGPMRIDGKKNRDRGGGERVLGLEPRRLGDDVRVSCPALDLAFAVLDEDDRATAADLGRGDRDGIDETGGDVHGDSLPRDLVEDEPLERRHVEEPGDPLRRAGRLAGLRLGARAEPERPERHRDDVAKVHAIDAVELERAPDAGEPRAEVGLAGVRREEARVDRADARAAQDREPHPPAGERRQLVEEVGQHPGLVGAARTAAGEHEGDARLHGHGTLRYPGIRGTV